MSLSVCFSFNKTPAEEVEDASINVPDAMWWREFINVFMEVVMLITMLFCIGPLDGALEADVPYLVLFQNTGSNAAAFGFMIILLILVFSGNTIALATTSREMWAFLRDKGFRSRGGFLGYVSFQPTLM